MFYFEYIGTLLTFTAITLFAIISLFKLYKELKQNGRLYTIKNILIVIASVFGTLYFLITVIPYWMDFPQFITGNYSTIEGKISNEEYWDGKEKYTNITINNNTYRFDGTEYPPIGTNVIVKYLPNTNLIYNIYPK